MKLPLLTAATFVSIMLLAGCANRDSMGDDYMPPDEEGQMENSSQHTYPQQEPGPKRHHRPHWSKSDPSLEVPYDSTAPSSTSQPKMGVEDPSRNVGGDDYVPNHGTKSVNTENDNTNTEEPMN